MKIAIAQLNYIIGDFDGNLGKMKKAVIAANSNGADLICFSELATCGYPPRDFLEFKDFIQEGEKSILKLCSMAHDIAIFVGSPSVNPVPEGKDLYNSVYKMARLLRHIISNSYQLMMFLMNTGILNPTRNSAL